MVNPRTRAQQKIQAVLKVIGKFGFASPENITIASGALQRGFGERLYDAGLLTKREVSGLIVEGKSVIKIYGLSKKGADLAGFEPVDIWKLSASRMAHALIAQKITIEAHKKWVIPCVGLAIDYFVEQQGAGVHSRPDVVLMCQNPYLEYHPEEVMIEVELSAKSGGELERFFAKLHGLNCLVYFENRTLSARYLNKLATFERKGELPKWYRRADGEHVSDGVIPFYELDYAGIYFRVGGEEPYNVGGFLEDPFST